MDQLPASDVAGATRGRLGRGSATAPLWILLVASLVAPAVLFGVTSWINYRTAFADAGHELMRTAEVAREQATRVFEEQSQVIDRVNDLIHGMDPPAVVAGQRSLHDALAAMVAHLPLLQSVLLVDREGHPLVSDMIYPVPRDANLAATDYFQSVVANPVKGLFVTTLQVNAITQQVSFGLARPWRGAAGSVEGVIAVAASPAFFEEFYRGLIEETAEGSDGQVITLVRQDGKILARLPRFDVTQPQPPSLNFLAAIHAQPGGGIYQGRSVLDPTAPTRLFAFRKLEGFPVYVVAGRDRRAVLASWRATMLSHVMFGLPAILVVALVTGTALVRTRREHFALSRAQEEIARRERAEAALLRAQRLEAVGQMTGGVAHDFNNLLTVILGSAELMLSRVGDPVQVRRLSEQIVLATRRGGEITQQLLTFSRRQFLSQEMVDLNVLLTEFQPLLARAVGDAVTVTLDLEGGLYLVRLDAGHFEAALLNLVGNARDAIPGNGRILITTRNATIPKQGVGDLPAGTYVRVAVADTGTGMSGPTAAKAFEPFFTTKEIGKGTGLGLSQVYGFAKQAGGEARITTSPGQGTTVELLLPRAAGSLPRDAKADPVAGSSMPNGELVVLVVEDDAAVLEMLVASVRDLGYMTITATTGEAALAVLLGEQQVDLLLSDVVMPGSIDGLQLVEHARRQRPGLKMLLTSGYTERFDHMPIGGVPVLVKPYNQEQLRLALRAL